MQKLKEKGYSFIGSIILICILLIAGFLPEYLQRLIFAHDNYLLIVKSRLASAVVTLLVFYVLYKFNADKSKYFKRWLGIKTGDIEENDETIESEIDDNDEKLDKMILAIKTRYDYIKEKTAFKIIKKCWIPILLIIIFYCGFCKNSILYSDSIKLTSAFSPKGIIYSYNDVKSVNVGIKKKIFFDRPYYEIILIDGKRVDFYKDDNDLGNKEMALIQFDNKLKMLGANKNIDKRYYDKYFKNIDDEYNNAIKKLFNDY